MKSLLDNSWQLGIEAAKNAMMATWLACRTWPGRNLLFVSLLLIALHIYSLEVSGTVGVDLSMLRVDTEIGFSEFWETTLLGIAALLYFIRSTQRRRLVMLLPAAILLYMAFDGSHEWHEKAGLLIYPANRHIGEIVFMGSICALFGGGMLYGLLHADDDERAEILSLLMLLAIFAFFSIFVDALHIVMRHYVDPIFDEPLALVEDGGELLAITVICALATSSRRRATSGWVANQLKPHQFGRTEPSTIKPGGAPAQTPPPRRKGLAADGLSASPESSPSRP